MPIDLLKEWFGKREVIVGEPQKPHDHRHTLQTGDSVVAVERAWREYEEDKRRGRFGEIASKIFEWVLILVAVAGFAFLIVLNTDDLWNKYGVAVPLSLVFVVVVAAVYNKVKGSG
jgi:hypothetical protein